MSGSGVQKSAEERENSIRSMFDRKSNSIAKSQEQKDRELQLKALELELYAEELDLKRQELDFRMKAYRETRGI